MTINTSTWFLKPKLTSPRRSVSNFDVPPYSRSCQVRHDTDTDTPSHTYVLSCRCTTGCEHVHLRGIQWSSTSFVERKSTSPRKSASNFDTYSTTGDWVQEAAYGNQCCSGWLEQYFRYSTRQVLQVYIYFPTRSKYNRTVCHLRRSGWLEVNTVEADSTIDYQV